MRQVHAVLHNRNDPVMYELHVWRDLPVGRQVLVRDDDFGWTWHDVPDNVENPYPPLIRISDPSVAEAIAKAGVEFMGARGADPQAEVKIWKQIATERGDFASSVVERVFDAVLPLPDKDPSDG